MLPAKFRQQLCFLMTFAGLSEAQSFNPFQKGPFNVTFAKKSFPPISRFKIDVYSPNVSAALVPVYFISGFQAATPTTWYSELLTHIASHGYIVIGVWIFHSPGDSDHLSDKFSEIVTWSERNLAEHLKTNYSFDRFFDINFSNSILSGQSSGTHIAVSHLLRNNCGNFKALAMISPVDSQNPFGVLNNFVIPEDGSPIALRIPSLTIKMEYDSRKGLPLPIFPACAPDRLSNFRFYNALTRPKWFVELKGFGHGDVLDNGIGMFNAFVRFCYSLMKSDKDLLKRTAAGLTVSFIKTVLEPSSMACEAASILTNASHIPIPSILANDAPSCSASPLGFCATIS